MGISDDKIENNETSEECLKRELSEEFSVLAEINDFFIENIHEYPDEKVKLLGEYRAEPETNK